MSTTSMFSAVICILTISFPHVHLSSEACGCTEVTILSAGGAYEHQPALMGIYIQAGSIWDGLVPYYKSSNNHYLTPDRFSDPLEKNYVKWIVSDTPMGFNGGIQNRVYTEGVTCPYDIPDQWEYLWGGKWEVDETISLTCTKWKYAD